MTIGITDNNLTLDVQNINNVPFYDLKAIYDERRAEMLLGQGVECKSDDKRFITVFRTIDKINKLDDLLLTYLQVATSWGVVYPTIGRNERGDWILDFADPNWINIVKDMNLNVWGGKIRKTKMIGLTPYYIDEFYGADGSVRREFHIHLEHIPALDWYNDAKVPKEFKLPEREQFPFCPLFKYINKAARGLVLSNNYGILAEDYNVRHIPKTINLILRQIYKHVIMSKDRIVGNVSQKWLNDMKNSDNPLAFFIGDMIVNTMPSDTLGHQLGLQQASPKITEYMDGLLKMLGEYMRGRKMSPVDDSAAQATEAETLFTKTLDVESCKVIKKRFTEFLSSMFDKIFIAEGLMTGEEETRPYALELKENLVFNELSLTNNVLEQIQGRILSRTEAISKLRGVDEEQAREILEAIDKDADAEQDLLLQQMASATHLPEQGADDDTESE